MVFSVNQVRQFYVAKKVVSSKSELKTPGDILVGSEGDDVWVSHVNALGEITRTDLINKKKIAYAEITSATKMAKKLKTSKVVKLSETINVGKPVLGQEYVLRVAFRQFIGMSDSDQYYKYGVVHVDHTIENAEDPVNEFWKQMVTSLLEAQKKEINPLYNIYLYTDPVTPTLGTTPATLESIKSASGIIGIYFQEAAQPWEVGMMAQETIPFEVQPTTITYDGMETLWGEFDPVDTATGPEVETLPEGQLIADLEYFCMGERADIYRNVGFPDSIPTKYLVDPSKTYDVLTIHYAHSDSGLHNYNSEKDIQIASETLSVLDAIKAKLK